MDQRFYCTFCSHVLRTIKGYADDCRFHRNECNLSIPCPVKTCQRTFSAYCGFRLYIHHDHGKVSSSTRKEVDQDILTQQCALVFYKQVCSNLKEFNKHLKGNIEDGSNIKCPYNGCENLFKNKSTFAEHLSRQYQSCSATHLPSIHKDLDMDISNELHPRDNLHDTDGDADELLSLPVSQETKDLCVKNIALFYLKLQSKYLLPASTIQHIMEDCKMFIVWVNLFFGINLSLSRNKMLILPETKLGKLVDLLLTILSYLFSVIPDFSHPKSATSAS